MRVAIVDSQVSFIHGGAEMLTTRLAGAMRALGHDVDIVRLPLNPADPRDIERVMDFSLGEDLSRWIAAPDVVVALRFPGYLVQHPDKRVWLLHQLRQYYEYYEQTRAAGNAQAVQALRDRLVQVDREALSGAARLWAQSARIADRLNQFNGLRPPPLYPPLPTDAGLYCGKQERYVFAPSRLERHKRQWLLIEAMRHVKSDVKAIIGGEGGAWADYRRMIEEYGLGDRVLLCGRLAHDVQAAWYANSLAVFFGPEDEDYGFVTLEAMASGKPVITCRDSGATLEFVDDDVNGAVVEADARMVADRIDALAGDPARARAMGMAGRERYRNLDLTWERTASVLIERGNNA
jgi:glycosyltransferase involved in cell wall biosynthesis